MKKQVMHMRKPNAARQLVRRVRQMRRANRKVPKSLLQRFHHIINSGGMNRVMSGSALRAVSRRLVKGVRAHASSRKHALRTKKLRSRRGWYAEEFKEDAVVGALLESISAGGNAKDAGTVLRMQPLLFSSPRGCVVASAAMSVAEDKTVGPALADLFIDEDGCFFMFMKTGSSDLSETILNSLKEFGESQIIAKPGDQIEEGLKTEFYIVEFVASDELAEKLSKDIGADTPDA